MPKHNDSIPLAGFVIRDPATSRVFVVIADDEDAGRKMVAHVIGQHCKPESLLVAEFPDPDEGDLVEEVTEDLGGYL